MPAGKRAHSLVELIIASALMLLMLTSIGWALVYCNNYLRNAETKIQAQTEALAASVWLSRSLSEANATASCTTMLPAQSVSFPSPRDPGSGDVAWSGAGGAAMIWRQIKFCYLNNATGEILVRGYPLTYSGTTPTIMWTGFPPFPTDGVVDLTGLPQPLTTTVVNDARPPDKVVARNIREFLVELYAPTDPIPSRASTANIVVESFVPTYDVNYGVRVATGVRLKN